MSRDYRFFLEDIRASCEKILRYTEGLNFSLPSLYHGW
jgi:uncharacterized protein with HEPN domain